MSDMKHNFDLDSSDAVGATSLDPEILTSRPKRAGQSDLDSSFAVRELQLISNQLFRAASELQRTNRFQSMILDNINQGVIVVDEYSQLVAWNEVFLRLYGMGKKALHKGMHVQDFAALFRDDTGDVTRPRQLSCNSQLSDLGPGSYSDQLENGTSIEIRVVTRDTGGFIATYTDITSHIDIQSRLEKQGKQLGLQVGELQALGQSLEIARNQAIQSDQQKSRFLAMISHDIRTPMSAVISTLELLANPEVQADRERLVDVALSSGRQMLYLLSDIIEVSRTDGWNFAIAAEAVAVKDLLASIADSWRPLAEKKGLTFDLQLCQSLPESLEADPQRLRQVIDNLLSNAIKFTEAGSVQVKAYLVTENAKTELRIEVSDTGRGISKDAQHALFQEFSRMISPGETDVEGTGLGLSICKRIIESMGGKMGAKSESTVGSKFWLQIPCIQSDITKKQVSASGNSEQLVTRDGRVPHILVADDVESNQILITAMLEKLGYSSRVAKDGQDVLQLLEIENFDIILMDNYMPNLDGVEATKKIRNLNNKNNKIVIIGTTVSCDPKELNNLKKSGMNHILNKPINIYELNKLIGNILQ